MLSVLNTHAHMQEDIRLFGGDKYVYYLVCADCITVYACVQTHQKCILVYTLNTLKCISVYTKYTKCIH